VQTSQKVLLSLLITALLFTAFTVVASISLFDLIETRFYNPSVTAHMAAENKRNAKVVEEFIKSIENSLSETLKTDAVRRSLMYDQNQEDFSALYNVFSLLGDSFGKIQWVRLIDSSGTRLYFSTYGLDIINHDYESPVYHSYNDTDLPYNLIAVENGGVPKYTLDGKSGSIFFSFPLYDSFDIYCGTALFSLSMDAVLEKLLTEGRMISGYDTMLIQNPPGMVFGILSAGEKIIPSQISSVWETKELKTARITSSDTGIAYILVSTKTSQGLLIGSIIKEELYMFSWGMKLILLVSFFLTVYLSIFLLLSIKQEPVTIIQSRLKHLQVSLLEQFYELKGEEDWSRWIREMDYRREEVSALLKNGIRPASGNLKEEIDTLINKSWDEFLSMLGGRREPGFDEEKLRSALNSMLAALPKAGNDAPLGGEAPQPKKAKTGLLGRAAAIVKELEEAEVVEELEELEEVEDFDSKEIAEEPAHKGPTVKEPEVESPAPAAPIVDLAALASEIEFSPENEPEPTGDDSIEKDLEIVSPFSAMLDGFTDTVDYDISSIGEETLEQIFGPADEKENSSSNDDSEQEIETIQDRGQQIISKPFSTTSKSKIETLQTLREDQSRTGKGNVIKEKEGLPFVSADALNPDEIEDELINQDFKNLVDSVIKD